MTTPELNTVTCGRKTSDPAQSRGTVLSRHGNVGPELNR